MKRSKILLSVITVLLVATFTVGCPEPKIEYRDRWHDCNDPTHGLVGGGECDCEEVTPNVCDDLWACVTETSNSLKAVTDISRDTCGTHCSDEFAHGLEITGKYNDIATTLWGERGGITHNITDIAGVIPYSIRLYDAFNGNIFTPCLTPAERTAAEAAAIAENNTIHGL